MDEGPAADGDDWKAWDAFLEAARGAGGSGWARGAGFMQSSWWARFRARCGFDCFAAIFKDQAAIQGGALVQTWSYAPGTCFYYIQDGPVLPADEPTARRVFARVLEIASEHRAVEAETVSHLRIEPRADLLPGLGAGFSAPPFMDSYAEPRNSLAVDLRPPEEALLAQMKPKGRYNIRVAQRHGVRVIEDCSERGLADWLRIYARTARRQGLDAKPPAYFRELRELASPPGKFALFFAEHEGRRLAAALVLFFGPRATYFFGGSLALRRRVMAPYLLHFEIMRRAKARSCECYDLWGVAPADAPDDPWRDISVFKRKFGGVEIRLPPTLDLVYDPAAYARYLAAERAAEAA